MKLKWITLAIGILNAKCDHYKGWLVAFIKLTPSLKGPPNVYNDYGVFINAIVPLNIKAFH